MPYVQRSSGVVVGAFLVEQSYATEFLPDENAEVEAFRNASVGVIPNDDLFKLNISALVVDAGNASQLITPNGFADGFTNTNDVDTAGSVNLDSSNISSSSSPLSGYMLPTRGSPSSIALNSGMLQGNMTSGGGLAALVNGTTSQTYANCAVNTAAEGWFSVALLSSTAIYDVTLYGSSNRGFNNAVPGETIQIFIYGKVGGAPTGPGDAGLVEIGTASFTDSAGTSQVITSTDSWTLYDNVLVKIVSPSNGVACAEVQMRQSGQYNALALKSISKVADTPPGHIRGSMNITVPNNCVLNTDIKLSFSRDGGTTRTYATLSEELTPLSGQSLPPGHKNIVVNTLETDISAQPSGVNMKYWVETLAKYGQHRVNNISMIWGA